jgi:hypothetical protein
VSENVLNSMNDPENVLKTVSASNYDRVLTEELYDTSNNVTSSQQLQSIVNENIKTENSNLPFPSTNSITSLPPSFFKKKKEI